MKRRKTTGTGPMIESLERRELLTLTFANGVDNDLVRASTGRIHLAYQDSGTNTLKYATWLNGVNTTSVIDAGTNVGEYVSIALDPNNNPGVSYYDAQNGDLKYAHHDGTSWSVITVSSANTTGLYTSVTFYGNSAYISHYHSTADNLRMARVDGLNSPAVGAVFDVDTGGDVGRHSSITPYPTGALGGRRWGVGYQDTTNGELKFALGDASSVMQAGVIDSSLTNGAEYISVAMREVSVGDWQPTLSYYDPANGDLKLVGANGSGTTWFTPIVIASNNTTGLYTSHFYRSGVANIVYYNSTGDTLQRWQNTGGAGTFSTLLTGGGRNATAILAGNNNLTFSNRRTGFTNLYVDDVAI